MTQNERPTEDETMTEETPFESTDNDPFPTDAAPSTRTLATTFDELIEDEALRAALRAVNFTTPTDVQAAAIPHILDEKDCLVQAKTGSGKTLSYVLPLLAIINRHEQVKPISATFALIIVPTRELAVQVTKVINTLSSDIKPVCVIGGVDQAGQTRELNQDPRIVIGTPGRLLDLLKQKILKLNHCRYFTLDEADEMLSMGFIDDVRAILSRMPDRRQGLFVSATITPRVEMLANSFLSKPEMVLFEATAADRAPIEHLYCEVAGDIMGKPTTLCDLIEVLRPSSAIIFCNTKSDTQLVEALLRRRGFDARRINSDLTQSQRDKIMKKIRAKDLQFLVATDIAARGLDIEQLDLVINYSIHEQPETYVHRTGRTGRAGRRGRAISLVGPRDFGSFHFLTKVLDMEFNKMPLPSDAEVADARLAHLYEILRKQEIELRERDLLVARKLLAEMGGITEPAEDLEAIVAKFARFTVEHHTNAEAKALEEELDGPTPAPRRAEREDEGRGDRRGRDRGDKSRERGRGRPDERGERDNRRSEPRAEPQGARSEGARTDTNRAEGGRSERPEGGRQENDRAQTRAPEQDHEVRVYIGQGTAQGMTADLFSNLAIEFGELKAHDVKNVSIREHYGFVDLLAPKAQVLIGNLNGIHYNGLPLPVELAASLAQDRNPRRGGQRHDSGRSDSGRGRGRRDDNRRSGDNRRRNDRGGRHAGGY